MNILIPMAGAGSRFAEAGYSTPKPLLPVSRRQSFQKAPMVVAAVEDLPTSPDSDSNSLYFVVRSPVVESPIGKVISQRFPSATFIPVDRLTEGQASSCLLASSFIDNDEALLISACDNGMEVKRSAFEALTLDADAVVFTFRGNDAVEDNPSAYGWVRTVGDHAAEVSVKSAISANPLEDHAVVGTFWFKRGRDFVNAATEMIGRDDRVAGEFYVDRVLSYLIRSGLDVRILEVSRYICWGTPRDYETFENTLSYWSSFVAAEPWL